MCSCTKNVTTVNVPFRGEYRDTFDHAGLVYCTRRRTRETQGKILTGASQPNAQINISEVLRAPRGLLHRLLLRLAVRSLAVHLLLLLHLIPSRCLRRHRPLPLSSTLLQRSTTVKSYMRGCTDTQDFLLHSLSVQRSNFIRNKRKKSVRHFGKSELKVVE